LASSYQWQFNSVDIPGATNQSYTILQTGYYTVIIGDSNSCKNSATVYVLITGIEDVHNDANISISPNPSSGNFTIELMHSENSGEICIDVRNALGQKVFSTIESIGTASFSEGVYWDKKEIDLSHLPDGVYYITFLQGSPFGQSGKIFFIKKLVIAR
jgi:hypothetical protein